MVGLAAGALLGAVTAWVVSRLKPVETPLAVLLALAAGIYVGFGLTDGRAAAAAGEIAGALPYLGVALIATRTRAAVGLLGAGWIAHGLWDALHEFQLVGTTVPAWYPAFCLGIDVVLGAAALAWARSRSHPV